MSFRWSYEPDSPLPVERPRKVYLPRKEKKTNSWVAPEHARVASSMRRDYPRDDRGQKIEGTTRELRIDKRPTIMIPARKTIMGWK